LLSPLQIIQKLNKKAIIEARLKIKWWEKCRILQEEPKELLLEQDGYIQPMWKHGYRYSGLYRHLRFFQMCWEFCNNVRLVKKIAGDRMDILEIRNTLRKSIKLMNRWNRLSQLNENRNCFPGRSRRTQWMSESWYGKVVCEDQLLFNFKWSIRQQQADDQMAHRLCKQVKDGLNKHHLNISSAIHRSRHIFDWVEEAS